MSKKRKMMIGVAVIIVGILIGSGMYVLLRSNTQNVAPLRLGEVELIFSELPTVNKTVNVTLTLKTASDFARYPDMYGSGFVFFVNESRGFEWITGKPWLQPFELWERPTGIYEPYFTYENCSGIWGRNGTIVELSGVIKVTQPGNWTIGGVLGFPANKNATYPWMWDGAPPTLGTIIPAYLYTWVTIAVGENSSYILEEVRATDGRGGIYYHYMHPSLVPEPVVTYTYNNSSSAPAGGRTVCYVVIDAEKTHIYWV